MKHYENKLFESQFNLRVSTSAVVVNMVDCVGCSSLTLTLLLLALAAILLLDEAPLGETCVVVVISVSVQVWLDLSMVVIDWLSSFCLLFAGATVLDPNFFSNIRRQS